MRKHPATSSRELKFKSMNMLDAERILTVTQLTRSIKNILESQYRFVRISGEISNLKTPYSGHSYFTLKDGSAQIRGVLFKQQKRFVDLALQDGQDVICFGRVTVYEPRGEYQIIADSLELFGTGQLQKEFEKLKLKLAEKGYFSTETKKALPPYPSKIIVISSPTGAAIQDFLKIASMRKSAVQIQILPVRVQGKDAAGEISQAIRTANTLTDIDIIVLCRGGGSLEDLWAFNEETVAEAIHQSAVPVVTGIGHEVDFTIADFCADYRCPTPTGAAEKLIPDTNILRQHLDTLLKGLVNRMHRKLLFLEQRMRHSVRMLANMKNLFKDSEFRLQLSTSYLVQATTKNLRKRENRLHSCIQRLQSQAPSTYIELQEKQLHFMTMQLHNHMRHILDRKKMVLAKQATLLNSVSPLATLGRGYSIVRKHNSRDESFQVITRSTDTSIGDEINILLHEGQLDCVVKEIK
ncbi:MAG: exodeoxyribonuclease VII large subunit [Desulforhopalus sp.]